MPYVHEGPSRLWLTEDGEVVEDGDERAAILLVAPGQTLSDEEATRYKLPRPAAKAEHAKANKAEGPKANKAA